MGVGDGEGMLQEQSHCTELGAVERDLSREVGHLYVSISVLPA